jgi:hypothetical protein
MHPIIASVLGIGTLWGGSKLWNRWKTGAATSPLAYQGPPTPPAAPSGKTAAFTLIPGVQSGAAPVGATVTFGLPSGAVWAGSDPVLMATNIGGTVTGGILSTPVTLTGFQGGGITVFNWLDAAGAAQSTNFTLSAG